MKRKSWPMFFGIILLAVVAAIFVYPKSSVSKKFLPWRLGLDLVGGSYLVYEADLSGVAATDRDSVMNGLRDVIEKRVNLFGVTEPRVTISKAGDTYRLNVELAGIKDINEAIKTIGQTPFLYFSEADLTDVNKPQFKETALTGRYITGAQLTFSQVGLSQVDLQFNKEGAKIFEDLTGKNVGKQIAIFLDGQPINIARVNEAISGGRAQITGISDVKEAKQLVERLNAGALPAPIKMINQQTISASLGQDSLQKTIWAGILGTLAVILFMLLYYRGLGFFSAVALIIYIALTLSVFKLFSVTMTLSGIAGFILSIAMAVDANILIFERTKEEIKKGLEKDVALNEGFRRAWTSIRDSNLTTILTALILYNLTSSFVKGFALTLLIGVLVSMFTALTVTENLLKLFYVRKK
ncbi:MAG: Protein translocase subunit SecD [Parcubacteria group bacterium Athens0714_26]|nr:MAG: preprotein translocase subunit SecD [Parcubacteria group bacterium Athens1014_26]TSD03316.1 MAG: Protein translocase subunit SecD [Parcubacteria group bacterium Athens0714_26]